MTHHMWFPLYFPYRVFFPFATFFWFIDLIIYVVVAGAFYSMFRKAGTPNAWLAFIPIAGLWPFLWTINRSAWNVLWLFIPVVNYIITLYWLGQLLKSFDHSPWLVLLALFPLLNLILLGILIYIGYSNSVRYTGNGPYGRGPKQFFY
ncbi:DUF5684 domain-containing protein [Alicyclobacillus mengziensis]|nr:DUF5684 domain-containing protein [Alicyclobacillus mengziensis]